MKITSLSIFRLFFFLFRSSCRSFICFLSDSHCIIRCKISAPSESVTSKWSGCELLFVMFLQNRHKCLNVAPFIVLHVLKVETKHTNTQKATNCNSNSNRKSEQQQRRQANVKPVCNTMNGLFKYNVQLGRCNSHKLKSSRNGVGLGRRGGSA